MELLIFWLGMALLTGWLAGRKGRSGFGWFLFGLVFWPAALIAILVIESRNPPPPLVLPDDARAGAASVPLPTATDNRRSYSSWIAGLAYAEPGLTQTRGEWLKRKGLGAGHRLQLQREPDNPHDDNAVAVFWQGQRCGYIPDEHDWIGAALDRGDDVEVFVESVERADDPLARIFVKLRIEAPARQRDAGPRNPASSLTARQIEGFTCIDQPDGTIQVLIGERAHVFADEAQLLAVIAGIRARQASPSG